MEVESLTSMDQYALHTAIRCETGQGCASDLPEDLSQIVPPSAGALPALIPGLPDDLAIQCLLRLTRREHNSKRLVCRRWNDLLQSDQISELRKLYGVSERWIFVLARDTNDQLSWKSLDPGSRQWYSVPKMPPESAKAYGLTCESFGGNLFVLGGAGWFKPSQSDVFRYDPVTNKWSRAAHMGTARCYAMAGVLEGQLYVAGGMGGTASGLLTSVEMYQHQEDRWMQAGDLPMEGDLESTAVINGRLLIRHMCSMHLPSSHMPSSHMPYAAEFDPRTRRWSKVDNEMTRGWHNPSTVLNGQIYMLDQTGGVRLMVFEPDQNRWTSLGRLSPALLSPPCKLAALDGKLYIVGRGSFVVVVDPSGTRRCPGLVVARRIEGVGCPSDIVLSCLVLEVY